MNCAHIHTLNIHFVDVYMYLLSWYKVTSLLPSLLCTLPWLRSPHYEL